MSSVAASSTQEARRVLPSSRKIGRAFLAALVILSAAACAVPAAKEGPVTPSPDRTPTSPPTLVQPTAPAEATPTPWVTVLPPTPRPTDTPTPEPTPTPPPPTATSEPTPAPYIEQLPRGLVIVKENRYAGQYGGISVPITLGVDNTLANRADNRATDVTLNTDYWNGTTADRAEDRLVEHALRWHYLAWQQDDPSRADPTFSNLSQFLEMLKLKPI